MEINREAFEDISMRLPYGVRGYVPVEVFNGSYDIIDGSAEYDDYDVLVELTAINESGEIEVYCLDDRFDLTDYNYTLNDFTPLLRPMESIPDDERNELCDKMFELAMEDVKKRSNGDDTLSTATSVFCIKYLLSRHYDINGIIAKRLAAAVTEENNPYNDVQKD